MEGVKSSQILSSTAVDASNSTDVTCSYAPHLDSNSPSVTSPVCNEATTTPVIAASSPASEFAVLFATAQDIAQAKLIAKELLNQKLVACVNIIPAITSIYVWEGVTEESTEVLLILKVGTLYILYLHTHSYNAIITW